MERQWVIPVAQCLYPPDIRHKVALGMADQNRNITVVDVFVHQNRITSVRGSQIYQMIVILTVVVDNLVRMPEFMEQLVAQNIMYLLFRILPMETVGTDQ